MNIFETISAVMSEIGAIGKNDKNTQQGFKYRGIDAVMNALAPALQKYKLFVVPEVLEQTREERTTTKGGVLIYSICKIKYTFYAEDGSFITATVIGEGMDSGDKATNKAMSVAFKYACFQTFCIPTEEMVDPDAECHEVEPKNRVSQGKRALTENDFITELQAQALRDRCQKDGVPIPMICDWYKVTELGKLTLKAYIQLNDNWQKAIDSAKRAQA